MQRLGLQLRINKPFQSQQNVKQITMSHQKDETRVAAGLKAAVHNPHVSEEAKERSTERLHEMGTDPEETSRSTHRTGGTTTTSGPTSTRVARDVDLEDEEEYEEDTGNTGRGSARQQETIGGKDAGNVLRGYKATMHNPRVSEEAKEHAEEVLKDHDAI